MESVEKPSCKLVGSDGNVFAIIANVSKALRRAGQADRAAEFQEKALSSASYEDVLALCNEYVEVE